MGVLVVSAKLYLRCQGCGSKDLESPDAKAENEIVVCKQCGSCATVRMLVEAALAADLGFARTVDDALARVRRVRQRFPQRR